MVGIGMRFTGQHFSHDHMFQTAFDGFHFFDALNFKTRESEQVIELVWIQRCVNIIFKPVIRDLHCYIIESNVLFIELG